MTKQLTNQTIGVGIIGINYFSSGQLNGLKNNGINIHGLLGNSTEITRDEIDELGIQILYESIDDMLADSNIDVVHVVSSDHNYFTYIKAALLAGKHIICEKPLMMSIEEVEELIQIATQKNLIHAINLNARMYPFIELSRNMIQNGELGDLLIIQGTYEQDQLGGLMDLAIYWLDLITFVTGLHVDEVFADTKTFLPSENKAEQQLEDFAAVILHFQHGVQGILGLSQIAAGRKDYLYFEINGSKGSVSWNAEKPNELWIGRTNEDNRILVDVTPSMLMENQPSYPNETEQVTDTVTQFYSRVYETILSGDQSKPPQFPNFFDGLYLIKLCDAIKKSGHDETWVAI